MTRVAWNKNKKWPEATKKRARHMENDSQIIIHQVVDFRVIYGLE